MKELMNLSLYESDLGVFDSDWGNIKDFLKKHELDGIELFVDNSLLPDIPAHLIEGVHLPYWMGRHRAWLDDSVFSSDMDEFEKMFLFGGCCRDDVISNFRQSLDNALSLGAAYGVFHVAYVELENVFTRDFNCSDRDVMDSTAAFLNEAVNIYPDGEPPVRLFFENLWWPGLTFLDPEDTEYFIEQLDFDNWAFVLDVGHLMNATMICTDEVESIDVVLEVLSRYSDEMMSRFEGIHFHHSLSGDFMQENESMLLPENFRELPFSERFGKVMDVVAKIDNHLPFESSGCSKIVEYVSPDYLTHEFMLGDFETIDQKISTQRSALHHL
ncbi:TIM barrel protein [Methanolobus sp. ZRKC3]|uniref:TIM barrel protein n=1 Tax=Methanolobus sp. ZRKC3 TaxID=3125786 RepID=UPI003244EF52